MDTISVIIPNFNRANLLGETLENILNQTLPPHEIIVVDDGSTDNIAPIIAKYQDRVIFTKNQRGKGPGGARNTGLEIATGKYIKFFDSDDLMTLNTLEVQLKRLKESKLPVVYSPYIHAKQEADGQWTQLEPVLGYEAVTETDLISIMVKGYFHPIFTMLFERSFLDDLGYWHEGFVAEDFELLFRIGQKLPYLTHTNDCAVFYRLHGNQIMGTGISNINRDLEKFEIFQSLLNRYKPGTPLYSSLNKAYLRIITLGTLNALPLEKQPAFQRNLLDKLFGLIFRLDQKLGRVISKTEWQPYHKPNSEKGLFLSYLNQLHLKQ